ncbi:hypothetical protein ACFQPF_02825 [Fictibacillus iocasae]|uniref:Uncharacterized protein n=1 Tax=Fictibacillus iocasae TaxID=2715437 RepID=A0ABW2NPJ5_9BACL
MVFILSIALFIFLALTQSLYVEIIEASVITILVMGKVLLLSRFMKMMSKPVKSVFLPALYFLLFCGWSFADITIDHMLFFRNSPADGQPMSIGYKTDENADDIFLLGAAATMAASAFYLLIQSLKKILFPKGL